MTIKELIYDAHKTAVLKGWWQGKARSPLDIAALIHSEISEFVECVRKPDPKDKDHGWHIDLGSEGPTPVGPAVELADAIIRIADYCGAMGWDMEHIVYAKMQYNAERPHRHGGKAY